MNLKASPNAPRLSAIWARKFLRPRLLGCTQATLLALLIAACSNPAPAPFGNGASTHVCASGASATNPAAPGSGGTGVLAREGLGGTGAPQNTTAADKARPSLGGSGGDGIGGTGSPRLAGKPGDGSGDGIGGTGIVGVVTGFASICVNGLELHYAPSTPVRLGQQNASAAALQVGQVVAVRANAFAPDKLQAGAELQAQQIVVLHAAVGPITKLGPTAGEFSVMGQDALALAPEDLAGLRVGDWVRVSGHRAPSGQVRASRVQGIAAGIEAAQVMGPYNAIQDQSVRVGSTPVVLHAAVLAQAAGALTNGREVSVSGTWDGTRLQAQALTLAPTRASMGAVSHVLLQGFVHGVQGQELRLGYESLQIAGDVRALGQTGSPSSVPSGLQTGQRVQVRARVQANQSLVVDAFRINPESGSRGSNAATSSDDSGRGRGRGRSGSGSGSDDDSSGQGRGRGRSGGDSGSGSSGGSSGGGRGGGK
jgi:hypothetical protein